MRLHWVLQVPCALVAVLKVAAAQEEPRRTPSGVGIDPALPVYDASAEAKPPTPSTRATTDWEFDFHGFMRAPLQLGYGPKNDLTDGSEIHGPPRVPDASFTDWRYTHNLPGPWTQLLFSYGNSRVQMTTSIAAYNHTNAGYRNLQSQLGINQAFLKLNFPDVFGQYGGLTWTVGSFSNRYGTAGKYNAGKYNTYLFGRTRVAGETLTAPLYLTQDLVLTLEHGIGAKLETIPFVSPNPRPEYLPYEGPEPQGTTWIHHGHAMLDVDKKVSVGLHFLESRSPDDAQLPGAPSTPGRMTITGADVHYDGDAFGHAYLGYSHIDAKDILSLADGIEVLHSFGGWQFKNNYFGRFDPRTGVRPPDESGSSNNLLFQYDVSVGKLARYPTRFRGNGPDLTVSLFGMFNAVSSENYSHNKFKWGAEVLYLPFEFFGFGGRYDLVQPRLDDEDDSFAIVSPMAVFRTAFITKEQVTLQYSRYFLGAEAYPAFPYQELDRADRNVFSLTARMWW